jgi:hypothetical protein
VAAPRTSTGRAAALAAAAAAALAAALAVLAGACGRPRAPRIVDPPEGISIAVYAGAEAGQGYTVVDDRRTIEVTGRRVLLDRIAPDAALSTLVIEPLGAARGALAIEQCARERLRLDPAATAAAEAAAETEAARVARQVRRLEELRARAAEAAERGEAQADAVSASDPAELADGVDSPLVACTVAGAPGRYRVRVHYVAAASGFQTQHEIAMTTPERATVSTRLTVATPAWGARGELVLYDGVPGAGDPPREVGRGAATLDGGTAVIAAPPREVPARLVRVYDGMRRTEGVEPTEPEWGRSSRHDVRVLLELDDPRLLRGPAHVRLAGRGGEPDALPSAYVPGDPTGATAFLAAGLAEGRMGSMRARAGEGSGELLPRRAPAAQAPEQAAHAGPRRLPLWIDPQLRGTRTRTSERAAGSSLADRFELTIANTGTEPREVWIEEPLRPARRREIARARGTRPELAGDHARLKVVVGPGQIERVGFTVRYTF